MEKCNDVVFGEMTYDHRWYKTKEEVIFGKKYNISIVASAYTGRLITDAQRSAYVAFLEKKSECYDIAAGQLTRYINENLDELLQETDDVKQVESVNDLCEMVTPTTILFKQDGTTLILMECIWDEENGVAVEVAPDVAIGSQDLFL